MDQRRVDRTRIEMTRVVETPRCTTAVGSCPLKASANTLRKADPVKSVSATWRDRLAGRAECRGQIHAQAIACADEQPASRRRSRRGKRRALPIELQVPIVALFAPSVVIRSGCDIGVRHERIERASIQLLQLLPLKSRPPSGSSTGRSSRHHAGAAGRAHGSPQTSPRCSCPRPYSFAKALMSCRSPGRAGSSQIS